MTPEKIPVKSSSHELLLRLALRNILNWSAEGYGVKTICLCALVIVVTDVMLGEGELLKSSAKTEPASKVANNERENFEAFIYRHLNSSSSSIYVWFH